MKKSIFAVFFFVVLFTCSPTVFAQDKPADNHGVYFSLVGGLLLPVIDADLTYTSSSSGSTQDFGTKVKYGYLYGVKVGWLTPFTDRILGMEFEYNHVTNHYDSFEMQNIITGDLSGKISLNLLMLNLLARKPSGRFHPYIGAGLGYADVKVHDLTFTMGSYPLPGTYSGGTKGILAYQVMVGVDMDVYKNFSVGIGYKYLGSTQKISYDTTNVMVSTSGKMETDYASHNLVLSVSYMF